MPLIRLLSGSLVALVLAACASETEPEESGETSEAVSAPAAGDSASETCSSIPGKWLGCCPIYLGCINRTGALFGDTACPKERCAHNYDVCQKGRNDYDFCKDKQGEDDD